LNLGYIEPLTQVPWGSM